MGSIRIASASRQAPQGKVGQSEISQSRHCGIPRRARRAMIPKRRAATARACRRARRAGDGGTLRCLRALTERKRRRQYRPRDRDEIVSRPRNRAKRPVGRETISSGRIQRTRSTVKTTREKQTRSAPPPAHALNRPGWRSIPAGLITRFSGRRQSELPKGIGKGPSNAHRR